MKNLLSTVLYVLILSSYSVYSQDTTQVKLDNINNPINDSIVPRIDTSNALALDTNLNDTASTEEATKFFIDSKLINDSILVENNDDEIVEEETKEIIELDTTKPYGVKFIKEFEMSGGTYHYLIMDAQHPEKLLHKPHLGHKNDVYDYEDLIVKLEYKGNNMTLYSIIFSEPIIGSLERFNKNYFVSDGTKILRVQEKTGHNHFFKEFEKLYLNSDHEILKGRKFKNAYGLVKFYNAYVEMQEEPSESSD